MYCPKCGAHSQHAESYCKRCGEWLPDIDALARPRLFRKLSREEKIAKMRILEAVSAGLSLTAAAIILSVLAGGGEIQMLFLSLLCCVLVAAYQMVNFYLGSKVHRKVERSRADDMRGMEVKGELETRVLGGADYHQRHGTSSAVEHTTELLEPVPRVGNRDK